MDHVSGLYESAPVMMICVCSPAYPFACALGAIERGQLQLPREIDVEMLSGGEFDKGGKQV